MRAIRRELPKLSTVEVVEDDFGFYLQGVATGERLLMRFDSARKALRYANEAFLVMQLDDIKNNDIMRKNKA